MQSRIQIIKRGHEHEGEYGRFTGHAFQMAWGERMWAVELEECTHQKYRTTVGDKEFVIANDTVPLVVNKDNIESIIKSAVEKLRDQAIGEMFGNCDCCTCMDEKHEAPHRSDIDKCGQCHSCYGLIV